MQLKPWVRWAYSVVHNFDFSSLIVSSSTLQAMLRETSAGTVARVRRTYMLGTTALTQNCLILCSLPYTKDEIGQLCFGNGVRYC